MRLLADQAFSRTAGAPLVGGNAVRLLKDGSENYPCWLEAIAAAQRWIHFETYILHDDKVGRVFADALIERAQAGVKVRLLVDWLGSLMKSWPGFWRRMTSAGIEVRSFGYPRLDSPLGWLSRDHRKMLGIDGRIAFVSGLCVGEEWTPEPKYDRQEWRDTGVKIEGPAVADVEAAFAESWSTMGAPVPDDELPSAENTPDAGDVSLRVIATMPATAGVFKLDQLVASVARQSLWITDAYFVGVSAYIRALIAAARDGVDVRLLLPGAGSDVAWVQGFTRAGYRQLIEGGVRIFEWEGPMIHAKTAVADSRWARVGSTNLNITSWLGNWELDVAIEDESFARKMEAMFEEDLRNASEVVLHGRKLRAVGHTVRRPHKWGTRARATRRAAAAGAIRMGRSLGAAVTARREIGAAEAISLLWSSLLVLGLGALALFIPEAIAFPLGVFGVWAAGAGLYRSWRLYRSEHDGREAAGSEHLEVQESQGPEG